MNLRKIIEYLEDEIEQCRVEASSGEDNDEEITTALNTLNDLKSKVDDIERENSDIKEKVQELENALDTIQEIKDTIETASGSIENEVF